MGSRVYLKTRSIKIMPWLWVCRENAIQCNTNNCRKSRYNQQNAIENRHIEHICVTHTMPNCWKGCWGEWSLLTGSLWNMLGKPWPLLPSGWQWKSYSSFGEHVPTNPNQWTLYPFSDFRALYDCKVCPDFCEIPIKRTTVSRNQNKSVETESPYENCG